MSVKDDRSLQAAVLAFKAAGKDLKRTINASTKEVFDQPWKEGVKSRARTRLEQRVLVTGTRVKTGNPPEFIAASSRRVLKGGLVPDTDWAPVEFGTQKRGKFKTYQSHSPKGTSYRVSRRTANQLPARRRHGPVYTTVEDMIERVPKLWNQIVWKAYQNAAEGD